MWIEAAHHKFSFYKPQHLFHKSLENEKDSLLAAKVRSGEVVFIVHATTLTDLILNKSHLTRCSLLLSFLFIVSSLPHLSLYPLLNLSSQTFSLTLTPSRSVTSHLSRWNRKSVMVIFYGNLRGEFPNASAVSGWKLGYGSPGLAVVEETHLWGGGGSLVSQVTPTAWEIRVGSGWCHACKEALPGLFTYSHLSSVASTWHPWTFSPGFSVFGDGLLKQTRNTETYKRSMLFSCFGPYFTMNQFSVPLSIHMALVVENSSF